MRIVTNPGCNLDEDDCMGWGVELLPQKIVVDGIPFDTRGTIDFGKVDGWVKRAARHPLVQGTQASEFAEAYARPVKGGPEVLCVMSSRKLIDSYDAAVAAARALEKRPGAPKIEVVDTLVTDVGMGLCVLAAVQARNAGLSLEQTASFLRRFAAGGVNVFGLESIDFITRGGHASFLQAWAANFFNVRPLLSLVDGATATVGRVSAKAGLPEKLEEYLVNRIEPGTAVWLGIGHGNAPDKARELARRLQERYRCEFVLLRPLSTSIYLNSGPGSVIAFVFPLEKLTFRPTPPKTP